MRSRLLPVLAILLSLVIFFGYTKLIYEGSVAEHRSAIASNEQALAAAADYRARANELEAERAAMDPEALARLERILPDSVNNVRTILDLDALARSSGIALASIDVSQESAEQASEEEVANQEPVASVNLSLSGKGTYEAFKSFLAQIERSERLLDIIELAVDASDTNVYSYQMTARLYWLR